MTTNETTTPVKDPSASTKPLKARPRTSGSADSSRHEGTRSTTSTASSGAQAGQGKGAALLKRPGRSASVRRADSPFKQPMPAVPPLPAGVHDDGEDANDTDSQEKLAEMTKAYETSRDFAKQLELTLFNVRTTLASKTEREHHLEAELAGSLQQAAELESQVREAENRSKQLEKSHLVEQHAWENERARLMARQEQLSGSLHRVAEQQQQRMPSGSSTPKPIDEAASEEQDAEASSRSSSTNVFSLQMAVQQKDRRIEALEEQVATLKHELNLLRSGNDDDDALLQNQLMMLKQDYAKLLDDVEGYQTLLQEKTLTGELFAQGSFMQSTGSGSGRFRSMRGRPDEHRAPNGLDLASELDGASIDLSEPEVLEEASREALESEILKLQESNKALTLYINTIVVRLMNKGFEHVLARDEKDVEAALDVGDPLPGQAFRGRAATAAVPAHPGILSRTRSMLGGRTKSDTTASSITSQESTPRAQRSGQNAGQTTLAPGAGLFASPPRAIPSSSPQMGSVSGKHGLRQLASSAVADHKSQAEAKRLAAQFKPKLDGLDAATTSGLVGDAGERGKGAGRTSWFSGWRKGDSGPVSPSSMDGAASMHSLGQASTEKPLTSIELAMPAQAHGVSRPETAQTK
ncbi:hypothetical protein BCR37DRAFT_391905 [Protomyces lactucae-debilis]|uniref:M protein, serotype 2.1 n=1 Tax=Protomyces lactucae-debilis TaxID=2754530 RepID=A0A1Y2FNL8_PROLT|nr:uncharacterized protein BCR37DRAFT_391905 [Protomyces lactucae-debilis]ORY84315.1 hypothetical protein BCR37DRAFT_391905 [Protomyces lactucae-debilis]